MASDRSYILVFSLSVTSQYGSRFHGNDDGCRMGKAVPRLRPLAMTCPPFPATIELVIVMKPSIYNITPDYYDAVSLSRQSPASLMFTVQNCRK